MNLKLEFEFSKADILKEVAALKKQIDDMRPLRPDVEGKVMQKLRLDWNYNSNAIEGNKLSYGETMALLQHGITAKGKPLKDHLDIQGHNSAIDFLFAIIGDERFITEMDIRALHEIILVEPYIIDTETAEGLPTTKQIKLGQYKTLVNHVRTVTGEIHYYSTPEETPIKMGELMEWFSEVDQHEEINSIVIAALFHHQFVAIHPFDDGNGRLARILMNLIFMSHGYPPIVIKQNDKQNYYSLLSQADVGDNWPFVEYIAEQMKSSLQLFLKAAAGGDIDEDEDIDKEIALFKIELSNKALVKEKKTEKNVSKIVKNEAVPLFKKLMAKTNGFNEFFFNNYFYLAFHYVSDGKVAWEYKHDSSLTDEYIYESKKYFTKVGFDISLGEFKNDANNFSVKMSFILWFHDYKYVIVDNNGVELISKLYHESFTPNEQQKIIKSFVINLKNSIKNKLEEKPKN